MGSNIARGALLLPVLIGRELDSAKVIRSPKIFRPLAFARRFK